MSLVPLVDWIEVTSTSYVLSKLIPLSSHVWSITPVELLWDDISSLSLLSIHFFLIDTSTWLYISFFLYNNQFIWWMFNMNVDTTIFWISYSIITFVCIQIILFSIVYKWGHSSKSPLLRLGKTFWTCFHLDNVNSMTVYSTFVK